MGGVWLGWNLEGVGMPQCEMQSQDRNPDYTITPCPDAAKLDTVSIGSKIAKLNKSNLRVISV